MNKCHLRTGFRTETATLEGKRTGTFADIILTYPFCSAIYKEESADTLDGNPELIYLAPSKFEQIEYLKQNRKLPDLFVTAYESIQTPNPGKQAKVHWKEIFLNSKIVSNLKKLKDHLKFDQKNNKFSCVLTDSVQEFQYYEFDSDKLSRVCQISSNSNTFYIFQLFDLQNQQIFLYEYEEKEILSNGFKKTEDQVIETLYYFLISKNIIN